MSCKPEKFFRRKETGMGRDEREIGKE